MGLKKFAKRLKKKVTKGINKLNPFKVGKIDEPEVESPRALVARSMKRQAGAGQLKTVRMVEE